MGDYYNDEMHHRQQTGDVGNAVLRSVHPGISRRNKIKAFGLPVALILIGVVLVYWGLCRGWAPCLSWAG